VATAGVVPFRSLTEGWGWVGTCSATVVGQGATGGVGGSFGGEGAARAVVGRKGGGPLSTRGQGGECQEFQGVGCGC
jgi:hypothetical protein